MQSAEAVSPEAANNRVTYRRGGWSEWYENTAKGLEQGFAIEHRPAGEGPLEIRGRVPGALAAHGREDGAVDFIDGHGACVVRYGELHVWDVRGEEIPSRLELDGIEIALVIDDDRAEYPLTVDPLMTSPAWTAESNQASANFGVVVSTAGDVNGDGFSDVIVGAHQYDNPQTNEGRAYVYLGSAAGLSTTAAWTAESDQIGAVFGFTAGTAGDVNGDGFSDVIVGAVYFDNGQTDEGRAYVYLGSATGLATAAAWTAESDQANANFGISVATAGDVNGDGFSDVIIGANQYTNDQNGEGRAFVYLGSAAGLLTTSAWSAESNQAGSHFGFSVATAGDVNADGFSDVIVGALGYDNGQLDEGRAFVYHGSASGLGLSAAWTGEGNQASGDFGWSVSTAGDMNGDGFSDVVVGAPLYDGVQTDEGWAFVYQGSPGGLLTSPVWSTEPNQPGANLGGSVGTAGDVNGDGYSDVIVGAYAYDNGQTNEGRAFVHFGSAAGFSTIADWTVESNLGGVLLGGSVATAGDVNGDGYSDVIVGAIGYDNPQTDEGRAFVYHGSAGSLATTAAWTAEGDEPGSEFGYSVASAGDVNGDGYADVIVGAWGYGLSADGRAYVYHGSAAGLSTSAAWIGNSGQLDASFGVSVATAGDVNGDGFSDVIVGAEKYDNGQTNEGRAFVYLGSVGGLSMAAAWTAEGDLAEASFGESVATAGDVNGDGFSDVIVGSRTYSNGQIAEGRAFVYLGSAAGLAETAAWTAESDQASAFFGLSVATAGDVNGDGFSDVIVGAHNYDNGQTDEGRAFVYHGSAGGLGATPVWTAESSQADCDFAMSVATAGDVNGDGFSDVIVGAKTYDNDQGQEGRAFVYHGSAVGLSTTADWTAEGNQVHAYFGSSVATAGDVNGDGYSDVVVGSERYDNVDVSEGRASVYHGSGAGLSTTSSWDVVGVTRGGQLGVSVATAGDVNGDGYADVIVGSNLYGFPNFQGKAFVYYGNGGPGRLTLPRQQRTDGTTPIAPLGWSDSDTQFRIRAILNSIYGRTRLQLEHEVKPLGVLFDGLGTVTGGYVDVGADGEIDINQLVIALSPDTQYHWRVRAKYDLVKTPFQRNGPWLHVPVNGWNEADLRTHDAQIGIEVASVPPASFLLEAPRPNPIRVSADIGYTLPRSGRVHLAVYDVTGREQVVLVDAVQAAGPQVATWNGRGGRKTALPAGVYFVRLSFDGHAETQKLVVAR
jgi:hypothetical protein